MPDISMCTGKDCSLKKDCYRFNANPSKFRQSYLAKPPIKDDNCDYYWPEIEEYD